VGKAFRTKTRHWRARGGKRATEFVLRSRSLGALGLLCLPILLAGAAERGPDSAERLPTISLWDLSANIRVGAGYKDNVTLSRFGAEASPALMSGLDLLVFRLPTGGAELSFMFTGDDTRFLSAQSTRKEQAFFALAQLKADCGGGWGGGLAVQYCYLDQVLDASTLDYGTGSIEARGHSLVLTPTVRRNLGAANTLELEFPVNRSYYARPLDDYWEGGPKLAFKHEDGWRSELEVSYAIARRLYDNRSQASAAGELLPDTRLELLFQRAEAAWRHHWDQNRHWRSSTKLGVEITQDNSSGYFDYKRYFVSEQLRFRAGGWELCARGGLSFYDYALQTVSATNPAKRNKLLLTASFRAEKSVTRKLKVFAEFEHERSLANVTYDAYRVNTVCCGLDWEL